MTVRIAIAGSDGRMGAKLIELATKSDQFEITHKLHETSDLSNVKADVLIDFTHPSAVDKHLKVCTDHGIALVLGTTGLSAVQDKAVKNAARHIPIVYSANFSIGVNVLAQITEKLSAVLDDSFDIEIIEGHHKHKKDAPSGTALMLGRAAAKGRNVDFTDRAVLSREGETGARSRGDIGFSTIRGGEIIGEHTVMYIGDHERIEIAHKASDRALFAQGALTAAKWAKSAESGLYSMHDVLNLSQP